MTDQDIRWVQRLNHYTRALNSLREDIYDAFKELADNLTLQKQQRNL
jgi:hypothetical protein